MMHIPIMEIKARRTLFDLLKEFPHTFCPSAHTHNQWQGPLGPNRAEAKRRRIIILIMAQRAVVGGEAF